MRHDNRSLWILTLVTTLSLFEQTPSEAKKPATDLDCTACVSVGELDFVVPEKPAHVVIVATSGGDYTSVSDALAAITPSASDPYLIKVMPGTYIDNITMKSYVHLKGAGREVTTIQSADPAQSVIVLNTLTNVAISGLTITGGFFGIANTASSPTVLNNALTGNMFGMTNQNNASPIIHGNIVSNNTNEGIDNFNNASPTIQGNIITGNGRGILNSVDTAPTIVGNTISGNTGAGVRNVSSSPNLNGNVITGNVTEGISSQGGAPTIISNTVSENGGKGITNETGASANIIGNTITDNGEEGVFNLSSAPIMITHNRITGNGAAETDIFVHPISTPNISFNVYDDIDGNTGVGLFNVKSDGTPAPAP
jgi:parallel beta-helix repeat protein